MLVKLINGLVVFVYRIMQFMGDISFNPFYALGWCVLRILSIGAFPKYSSEDGDMQSLSSEIIVSGIGFVVFLAIAYMLFG